MLCCKRGSIAGTQYRKCYVFVARVSPLYAATILPDPLIANHNDSMDEIVSCLSAGTIVMKVNLSPKQLRHVGAIL